LHVLIVDSDLREIALLERLNNGSRLRRLRHLSRLASLRRLAVLSRNWFGLRFGGNLCE
jgi:hypothetical protein